jgi:thiol:disulfide interchange protein DsbC
MLKHLKLKQIIAASLIAISPLVLADEASLKKAIEAAYPKFKVESITKTPMVGFMKCLWVDKSFTQTKSLLF